jgi:magnesium transporter
MGVLRVPVAAGVDHIDTGQYLDSVGAVTVWLDPRDPDHDDLAVVSEEFGLHPLAVEDAVHHSQRPKLDRYPAHLFLTAYATRLDAVTGELTTSELAVFITGHALITVRKDDGLDIGAVLERWDGSPDLDGFGVATCCTGCSTTSSVPSSSRCRAWMTAWKSRRTGCSRMFRRGLKVQRRSFQLRKGLVLLRRIVIPMREVVSELMRRDLRIVGDELMALLQDVYDQVLRAAERTDRLRDLVTSVLDRRPFARLGNSSRS